LQRFDAIEYPINLLLRFLFLQRSDDDFGMVIIILDEKKPSWPRVLFYDHR
jgi:hypothetical protein